MVVTIHTLIYQGRAIRGVLVRLSGTDYTGEVSHATEVGVYLIGDNRAYDPGSLNVIG